MKPKTKLVAFALVLASVLLAGCGATGSLARSDRADRNRVAPTDRDRDVLLAAIAKNQTALGAKIDSNIEKGLVIKNETEDFARDTKGEVVVIELADGTKSTIATKSTIDVRLNSFHELAQQLEGFELDVATRSTAQVGTNQVFGASGFDGLRLRINNAGGAGLKSDNIRALSEGRAVEKSAAAKAAVEAIRARWEGLRGLTIELSNGARGIIREVNSVTPMGVGRAAVEMVLENEDGETETAIETVPIE